MAVYAVTYIDEAGDTILPEDEHLPRVFYGSIQAAESVAKKWMNEFDKHRWTLYGEAYPYDQTTLEQEVRTKGRAPVGWVTFEDEDGDSITYTIQIIAMRTTAA